MALAAQVRGEGRPVVILPWFSLDHAVAAAAFEPALADSPWRRIYLDLPGTGKSAPGEPRSDAVADSVAETIEDLAGSSPVLLVGCSYGGYLAAELARRDPARVAALLMVCSGVRILPGDRDLSGVLPSVAEPGWLADVRPELHEHFAHAVGFQTTAVARRLAGAFDLNGPTDDDYLGALRAAGYQLSTENSMPSPEVPVTVMAGRRDRVAGYRDQFEFFRKTSGGDYVVLNDIGHYLPFEQPERFRELIRGWLDRGQDVSEPR